MHTPEKVPANKGAQAAQTARPPVTAPGVAARGPMTPAAVLTLQRAVGNQAVSRAIAQEEHVHGADCGHGAVQRRAVVETAEAPVDVLNEAMSSASRPIAGSTLKKAQSFYQNERLSLGRVHTGPLAQRAVAAFGAKAMTVGTHIFFGAGAEHDPETAGHEFGHLDKNTRGVAETGTDTGTGAPVTNPGQRSEREAASDGVAYARGADIAPSVAAQRAVAQNPATGATDAAVQRMEDPARHGRQQRRHSPDYEADASASDSSPERRALRERIEQELAAGQDLGELSERLEGMGQPGFRRVRRVHHSEPSSESSESEVAAPAQGPSQGPAQGPAQRPAVPAAPPLPEHERLTALHELLTKEQRRGGTKKLKVTFNVSANPNDTWDGHAWIAITDSKGKQVTVGFFPQRGGNYQQLGSVQGGVACPDPMSRYGSTHHESKNVSLDDVIRGYHLIHSKAEANYNFTMNNCTTFATSVWTAMTNKTIPHEWFTPHGVLNTVISTPYGAAEGLEGRQESRRRGRHGRLRPLAEGPVRGMIPGAGTADEVAERMARANISQSSSQSSEEVD